MSYVLLTPTYAIMIVLSSLNKASFSYTNDLDSLCRVPCQPTNGFTPILVTLFGILMLVREQHEENADFPMLVTLFGILMLVRDLHEENTLFPILVTLSGMLMLASDSHLENAELPMLVTLFGM